MKLHNNLYSITHRNCSPEAGTYVVRLLADCVIYRAHFPQEPVTPGVCLVQMAVELLSDLCARQLTLTSARNLKFLSIVRPSAQLNIAFSRVQSSEDGSISCQVQLTDGEVLCSKFSIVCRQR